MESTAEQLRSKHVRTLELLQKTLDANALMKKQLDERAPKGFQMTLGQGIDVTTRIFDLERELVKLKQESIALNKSNESKLQGLEQRIHELQTSNYNLKLDLEAKEIKVAELKIQREELKRKICLLQEKVENKSNHDGEVVSKALEARAAAESECVRMSDTIEKLQKKEWTFAEQIETLRAQKLAFENEHAVIYHTLDDKDRQIEKLAIELQSKENEVNQLRTNTLPCKDDSKYQMIQEAHDKAMRSAIARQKQLSHDNQLLQSQIDNLQQELLKVQNLLWHMKDKRVI
ncbi:hypothetical protein THRCLA_04126 [Thraustotheca clavata]|uniref:Uncharacterized protein n=1 Tax=Thraustotheca clavata TaxID=74557 RepID=A0A1V9ZZU2_9STRA|nr:hypothetical protein THRCLA_04126 [Thraustotheca clavata]